MRIVQVYMSRKGKWEDRDWTRARLKLRSMDCSTKRLVFHDRYPGMTTTVYLHLSTTTQHEYAKRP